MQATKTPSTISAEAPSTQLFSELLYTFIGAAALVVLLAGASFPRRVASDNARTNSAIVQPARATGATVARSLPTPAR